MADELRVNGDKLASGSQLFYRLSDLFKTAQAYVDSSLPDLYDAFGNDEFGFVAIMNLWRGIQGARDLNLGIGDGLNKRGDDIKFSGQKFNQANEVNVDQANKLNRPRR